MTGNPQGKHVYYADIDYEALDRDFDRVKAKVFLGKNAAFMGPLMCGLNFHWSMDVETAGTNGLSLQWNPKFYWSIPFHTRVTILVHELWHVALLHMLRRGDRDPEMWNISCDVCINNMLVQDGYTWEGFRPYIDRNMDNMPAEEIYEKRYGNVKVLTREKIISEFKDLPEWRDFTFDMPLPEADLIEPGKDDEDPSGVINTVIGAYHSANMSGGPGSVPGEIELILKRFLSPKLPWEQLLHAFFHELANHDYRWNKPNRRYADIYLPSLQEEEEGGLDHIMYFLDVSGSISDMEVTRFNSEVKYIKDTFNPEKLSLIQFDTKIQDVQVFEKEDPFEELLVKGRGGTSLDPVHAYIVKHKPTAVVVFSDLHCPVMENLPIPVPLIWICINNPDAKVTQGQLVHILE